MTMLSSAVCRLLIVAVTAALVLTGCGPQPAQPSPTTPTDPPTIIFYNGTVLTMDAGHPTAEALAVADEKIVAVGANDDILALQRPDTQLIDLQGHTLMPGFVDTHSHILNEAASNPEIGTLENAQEVLVQNGITTIGNMYTTRDFLAEMRAVEESGQLRVRTSLYLAYTTNCGDVLGDWYREFPPTHEPGEMLRIAGVKVFTDGGSCRFPAVSFDHPVWGEGDLFFTQDEMNTMVSEANQAGYQVAIHAIGDRAVEQALNALEFAQDGGPNTLRNRIEHNTIVRPDLLPRYQEVGAMASVIGNIWSCDEPLGPQESRAWWFPYRGLFDAGPDVHIGWHADYPWSSQNPFFHLYSMVTPQEIAGDGTECADPPGISKTLTVDEALPMMTREGAYIMSRDDEVGSLEPGKYADLIVVSGDPTTDLEAIRDIEVWMTMVGGHTEWCAPDHDELCPRSGVTAEAPISDPVRIQVQLATTSDWATLSLTSGGTLINPRVLSASAEATNQGANDDLVSINQPIESAESGASVQITVEAYLSDARADGQLQFVVESGAIGDTTVTLFNYLQDSPVEAQTFVLHETRQAFTMPAEELTSP
jgi:predicted amidohydrolase YtcJ